MKNYYLKTTLSFISLIFLLAGCGNAKETLIEETVFTQKALIVESMNDFSNSAYTEILTHTITGNKLSLVVTYSGGCEAHAFQLLATQLVTNGLPPQRHAILYHESNDDACRERIEETIIFDISDLAINGNETIIKIKGYKEDIKYNPK
jgi:hypothetical protein